ncbi:MAG: fibronectin type 3 domain-containing protein, partial [Gammaproteobacteria bacterium]
SPGDNVASDVFDVKVNCNGLAGSSSIDIKLLPVKAARLTWTAPTLTEDGSGLVLEAFKVYHGPTSGSRAEVIDITDATATEWTVGFTSGPRFFEITAIGNVGLESQFSNEEFKEIP